MAVLKRSAAMGEKYGLQVIEECDGNAAVAATTAALMLSTFAAAAGMSMHSMLGLIITVHKQTERLVKENS